MTKREGFDKRLSDLFGALQVPHIQPQEGPSLTLPDRPDDFDIVALMKESEDPDTGLIRDLKIDDRDLPRASSYYDYAFNIIGKDAHPPWFIQMWIGLMLFGEVCPCCSNKKWLSLEWVVDNVPVDKPSREIKEGLKILRHGVCPKCKRAKWDLIQNHGLNNFIELVNVLGQRSGKSSTAASYAGYASHCLMKFPRLADLTSAMQKSTELTGTFVSLTYNKAASLLWTPYINGINESTWWNEYHRMLDFHSEKYGMELYRKKDEFIKWYHKGIKFYPSGPKSSTLRGDTRVLAAIDELGLFPLPKGDAEEDEQSERANADEAHKSLTRSLTTVQGVQLSLLKKGINCPPALMLGVSSPYSIKDKVMRLLEDSRVGAGKKYILGIQLPTWKVNPNLGRDTPTIALAYEQNYEKADRDYGANPPRVHQTFIKPGQVPFAIFKTKNSHEIQYQYDKPGLLYAKVIQHYTPKYPSIVCLDAGHANNSFTLVGGHFDFQRQKTVVSTVLEIMTHDGRRIDFNSVYLNVILPVCKQINAVALLADQWQSLDLLSRARADLGTAMINGKEEPRCLAKQYSSRRKDFDTLVSMMENESLELPFLSRQDYDDVLSSAIEYRTLNGQPMKHLFLQILTVADDGPNKCPIKGAGFTDDIFRALVLITKMHEEKVLDRLKKFDVLAAKEVRAMPAPVFAKRGWA